MNRKCIGVVDRQEPKNVDFKILWTMICSQWTQDFYHGYAPKISKPYKESIMHTNTTKMTWIYQEHGINSISIYSYLAKERKKRSAHVLSASYVIVSVNLGRKNMPSLRSRKKKKPSLNFLVSNFSSLSYLRGKQVGRGSPLTAACCTRLRFTGCCSAPSCSWIHWSRRCARGFGDPIAMTQTKTTRQER